MRASLQALALATAAVAVALPKPEPSNDQPLVLELDANDARATFSVPCQGCLGGDDDESLVFDIQVFPSAQPCGQSNVTLNGRSLNQNWQNAHAEGAGLIPTSSKAEPQRQLNLTWKTLCLFDTLPESDESSAAADDVAQLLTVNVGQIDDQPVKSCLGFSVSFKQFAQKVDLLRLATKPFRSASEDTEDWRNPPAALRLVPVDFDHLPEGFYHQGPSVEEEIQLLQDLEAQERELRHRIDLQKERIKALIKENAHSFPGDTNKCDNISCALKSLLHKAHGAIRIIYVYLRPGHNYHHGHEMMGHYHHGPHGPHDQAFYETDRLSEHNHGQGPHAGHDDHSEHREHGPHGESVHPGMTFGMPPPPPGPPTPPPLMEGMGRYPPPPGPPPPYAHGPTPPPPPFGGPPPFGPHHGPQHHGSPRIVHILMTLASISGLAFVFKFIRKHCCSLRRRTELRAACEERRTAREYRRLARRHAWRNWWHGRKGDWERRSDYDEKRALILDQEDRLEEAMQDEIRQLQCAQELAHEIVRAEEGRATQPFHSHPPDSRGCAHGHRIPQMAQGNFHGGACTHGMYAASMPPAPHVHTSMSCTTSLPSTSLPSYKSDMSSVDTDDAPPAYEEDADNSDIVVDGFRPYNPSVTTTAYTPESSIPDVSPRPSAETLRRPVGGLGNDAEGDGDPDGEDLDVVAEERETPATPASMFDRDRKY
ncbi:uncharacterized protein IWZ02DRAFT_310031 [Phyllosticta citriasiana]|uniref:uncharacterized protein n=1 Tax=Phyllosticta citriasiana TaxID=595635 RepID=UPI0030FDCA76